MKQKAISMSAIVIVLAAFCPLQGQAAILEIEDTATAAKAAPEETQPTPTETTGYSSPFEHLPEWIEPMPYSISGKSKEDLKSAIRVAMPGNAAGAEASHFAALTIADYTYQVMGEPVRTPEAGGDSCTCTATGFVEVGLSVSLTYPVWVDMVACKDSALVGDWAGYVAAIYSHELGHAYAARAGLVRLNRELGSIRTRARGTVCDDVCDRAGQAYLKTVEDTFRRVTAEIEDTQTKYDSETGYGRDRGATF